MMTVRELLLSTIEEKRPLVLLLGQDAWRDAKREDAILTAALEKLGRDRDAKRGWSATLSRKHVPPGYYGWLSERFERRVHPPFVEALSELPLSAVFTSSIDQTLVKLFSRHGRQAEPILTNREHPTAARSRARPPLYYLFSRAGEGDPNAQPPKNISDARRRRSEHAQPLLGRILDTATPIGLIVVDGFGRGGDWLKFNDTLDTLSRAGSGQVLWFGGRPNLDGEDADYFSELEDEGRILVEPARLSSVIAELRATGRLDDAMQPESEDAGVVSVGGSSFAVSPAERLRAEAAAAIIDDSWTAFLPPLGEDSEYDAFRRFHGILGGQRLLVEGVRRGFAIERDFERELARIVDDAIADHSRLNSPIIVEGQSGTGKSVALARIVAKVRERKAAAVLYAIERIPQTSEISDFCQRADRAKSPATLVVCDANRDVDAYDELLTGLRSRGRRAVVLGSQYRTGEGGKYPKVEAPSALSETETGELSNLVSRRMESPRQAGFADSHFLAALYRVLPASRPRIGSGLGDEARSTARTLDSRGRQTQAVYNAEQPITQLHEQLIKKGYISEYQPVFDDQEKDPDAGSAGKIIDMVMVAGRLDCPVPVNLLLRAISGQRQSLDSSLIYGLFRDLDLFRWTSRGSEGRDWTLRPRLTLEAQLICEQRLVDAQAEAKVLVDLIGSALHVNDDAGEREFLLNLLQKIGRDGFKDSRYKRSYTEFARKLTELRERFNVVDASLMLQESAFRRWAIREDDEKLDDVQRLDLLGESLTAVQTALDGIDSGRIRSVRRTRQRLLVERASVYGFLARYHTELDKTSPDIWPAYETARVAVRKAVSAASNYYPHDVGLWIPSDLLNLADLDDIQRAELAADIYSNLAEVETDALSPYQRNRFEERRMRVGYALENHALSNDAYAQLEKAGATAGYFLRARNYAPDFERDAVEIAAPSDLAKAKKAADFLEARFDKIQSDERCLWLLLENRWIAEMKRRPLRGERQPLPVGDARRRLLEIVQTLNQAAGESARYGTRYLEAVLTWLLEEQVVAGEIFRQLFAETDSVYRGRMLQRHVMTDSNGEPVRFTGRVERRLGEGRWNIRVDQLGQTVALLERSFPNEEIRYGRTLSDFTVSFNFIGPIADTVVRR